MKRLGTAVCALVLLLGCDGDRSSEQVRDGVADPAEDSFASPEGFPIPFTTRVPEGLRALSSAEGAGAVARFESTEIPDAFVHLLVHPGDRTADHAEEVVRSIADSYGPIREFDEVRPIPRPAWAEVAYQVSGQKDGTESLSGFVALGRRDGHWFHILVQYPRSQEARFRPRAEQVLESWRWLDTGESLQGSKTAPGL